MKRRLWPSWSLLRTLSPRNHQFVPRRHTSSFRPYLYQPLHNDEIRLIDLQPGRDDEPLRCTLRSATLSSNPPYESLSYCWGLNKAEVVIRCDNGMLLVTRNSFAALKHLRERDRARTLWMDALCIHQADTKERGLQVSMMRSIFQASSRTVVWLGESSSNSTMAIELIHKLSKASKESGSHPWWTSKSKEIPPLYDPVWRAFADLLRRPWFTRAWVVQEAAVSKDLLMVCGSQTFAWDDFVRALQHAVDLGVFVAYGGSMTFQALRLIEARNAFQLDLLYPLLSVLIKIRTFLASDSRDKIFGLLSLVEPRDLRAMGIEPNYNLSANHLYTGIARGLIARGDFSILGACGVHDQSQVKSLPSWVPDWSASDPSVPLAKPSPVTSMLQAGGSTPCIPRVHPEKGLLGLDGILIDRVESIGVIQRTRYLRRVSHMFELFVQCRDMHEQLRNWEQVAKAWSREPYITGEKRLNVYWQTLCAGRLPSGTDKFTSVLKDSRFIFYVAIKSLRPFVRLMLRCIPRHERDTWYNRFFYSLSQKAWRALGLTSARTQRFGIPPRADLSNYRRIVRTEKGYLALAPRYTMPGDSIGIFKGGKLPLVVRQEGDYLTLVGESYVHGIMQGKAWDDAKSELMWFK